MIIHKLLNVVGILIQLHCDVILLFKVVPQTVFSLLEHIIKCNFFLSNYIIPLQKSARLITDTENFCLVRIWWFFVKLITDQLGHVGVNGAAKTTVRRDSDDHFVVISGRCPFSSTGLFVECLRKNNKSTSYTVVRRGTVMCMWLTKTPSP